MRLAESRTVRTFKPSSRSPTEARRLRRRFCVRRRRHVSMPSRTSPSVAPRRCALNPSLVRCRTTFGSRVLPLASLFVLPSVVRSDPGLRCRHLPSQRFVFRARSMPSNRTTPRSRWSKSRDSPRRQPMSAAPGWVSCCLAQPNGTSGQRSRSSRNPPRRPEPPARPIQILTRQKHFLSRAVSFLSALGS